MKGATKHFIIESKHQFDDSANLIFQNCIRKRFVEDFKHCLFQLKVWQKKFQTNVCYTVLQFLIMIANIQQILLDFPLKRRR